MKNPLNIDMRIESCRSAHGRNIQDLSQTDSNPAKNSVRFIALLSDKIKNVKNEENLNNTAFPLHKDHLQRLIDAIKIQMNNYLFHELSNFDEGIGFPKFHDEWPNFYGTENHEASFVSKNEHDPQKTTGVKSTPNIDDIIEHASKIYDVDPSLIRAVIKAESNFDADSTSSKGAMGLMQLMPETAKDLGVKNCYNPVENIMGGTRYLKGLLKRYDGNVDLTLAAYNWGMGNVERHPGRLPQETRTYIARVNEFLRQYTS